MEEEFDMIPKYEYIHYTNVQHIIGQFNKHQ